MKTLSRQPKSRSRDLNLAKHPDFGREYNEWTPGGRPAGYFVYTYRGYEIRLRYSLVTDEWTALCLFLNIKKTFPDQTTHQDIQELLNSWITDHIEQPSSPEARLRINRPRVQEVYDERAF